MRGDKERHGKNYKTRTVVVASDNTVDLKHRIANLTEQLNALQTKAYSDTKRLQKELLNTKDQHKSHCKASTTSTTTSAAGEWPGS